MFNLDSTNQRQDEKGLKKCRSDGTLLNQKKIYVFDQGDKATGSK